MHEQPEVINATIDDRCAVCGNLQRIHGDVNFDHAFTPKDHQSVVKCGICGGEGKHCPERPSQEATLQDRLQTMTAPCEHSNPGHPPCCSPCWVGRMNVWATEAADALDAKDAVIEALTGYKRHLEAKATELHREIDGLREFKADREALIVKTAEQQREIERLEKRIDAAKETLSGHMSPVSEYAYSILDGKIESV